MLQKNIRHQQSQPDSLVNKLLVTLRNCLRNPLNKEIELIYRIYYQLVNKIGISNYFVTEAFWSFALKVTNIGLAFLTTIFLARLLGVEGYGIYSFAYALTILLGIPVQSGLPNLILRETARGMATKQSDLVKGAWKWSRQMVLIFSLIVIIGLGPLLIWWQGGLNNVKGVTLACSLLLIPFIALGNLSGAVLRGFQNIIAGQLPEFFIRPGLYLLLIVGVWLFYSQWLTPPRAMFMLVLASLMAFVFGAWLLWQKTPKSVSESNARFDSRGWLVSSTLFALLAGFHVLNSQLGTIILGIYQSPISVGTFRVAVQVSLLASFGLDVINQILAPRFASLYAQGEKEDLQRLVTASARIILIFNIILTSLFIVMGRNFFLIIFGTSFLNAYFPLLILLVGQMFNSLTGSVGFLLNMTGHEYETMQGMAIAGGLNIVLSLLLTPRWGIFGTATATSISMIIWNAILWWRVRQKLCINSFAFDIFIKR